MTILLPRLPGPAAENLFEQIMADGISSWPGFDPHNLPETVRFAPTGGTRVNHNQLVKLRETIVRIAGVDGHGRTGNRISHAKFDTNMAVMLVEEPLFASGEALRDDVWAFIGATLAPDIVHWRFGAARERYLGGVRNTFQRLWMRGQALDRGNKHPERWQLLVELTEDALVQITERPSLCGDPYLARTVAEVWLRAANQYGRGEMEPIMRRAILRIRVWNEIRSLADLTAEHLERVLAEAFGLPFNIESEGVHNSTKPEKTGGSSPLTGNWKCG